MSSLQRYSNGNWSELISLPEYYRNAIVESNINGYIQSLGHDPSIVHLYTEDQINILRAFKDTSIVVHLDATGSVIGRPILYSTSPVPLAEMISSGHTSAEISYFLHK